MVLLLNSLAHFSVDALCASALFGLYHESDFAAFLLLYNTLAFSGQCLFGIVIDRTKNPSLYSSYGMLFVIIGFILPFSPILKTVFLGLGNCVFHVASGIVTLRTSNDKAGPLGIFVAPGAVGLSLGTLFPQLGIYFAGLLFFTAIALPFAVKAHCHSPSSCKEHNATGGFGVIPLILLTTAVAVRALGGNAVIFPWKTTHILTLALSLCVFLGKCAGGFLLDGVGARKASLISLPIAAVMIAYSSSYMIPSMLGQFALNLTMPVTLYLMYKLLPDRPGFAFGLAASALWPGFLIGEVLKSNDGTYSFFIMICMLFGLAAILYSIYYLKKHERSNLK